MRLFLLLKDHYFQERDLDWFPRMQAMCTRDEGDEERREPLDGVSVMSELAHLREAVQHMGRQMDELKQVGE